jgi:AcrR family transcriptional regulator
METLTARDKGTNEAVARERLLDEAERLFAEKGFHAVSVREITRAAGCNLAAVNYHFGNKDNLYLEVFRSRWLPRAKRIQERVKRSLADEKVLSPAAVVRALARGFLEGPLSDEERQRHVQLMTREITQPTEAFEFVAEQVMRPYLKEVAALLKALLPAHVDDETILLHILSIFAMVLHFNFGRTAVTRITGRSYDPDFRSQLVEHIVSFAMRGIGMEAREARP